MSEPDLTPGKTVERIRSLIERIWNEKKPELIDELIDAECVIQTPDGEFRGPRGYQSLYQSYVRAFPDCYLKVEETVADGEKAAFSFTFAGTHTGTFRGRAGTESRVAVRGMSLQRTAEGKLTSVFLVWDRAALLEQVGVLVTEPAGS